MERIKEFAKELLTYGLPYGLPIQSKKYTSLPKEEMEKKLKDYFGWLRIRKLIPKIDYLNTIVEIYVLSYDSKFIIISTDSKNREVIKLHYRPHILAPYDTSFKWEKGDESFLTTSVLHGLAHLLHLGDFYFRKGETYRLKLFLPTLPLEELKIYDRKFQAIWNAFCILREAYMQPEIWEAEFERFMKSGIPLI